MEFVHTSDLKYITMVYKSMIDVFPNLSQRVCISEYLQKIANNAEVVVLKEEKSVVGFMAAYMNNFTEKTAYISLIGIVNGFRGKGFGSQLFEYCLNTAKRKGMTKLRLEVDKDNITAINFYKKHGMNFALNASEFSVYMEMEL